MTKKEKLNKELFKSAEKGDLVKLKQALENGAEVNATTDSYVDNGATPLFVAANWNHLDCVVALLKAGANVHQKTVCPQTGDRDGGTVLHLLLLNHEADVRVLRVLLDAGASVDASMNGGQTPLSEAAVHDNLNCVKLLLQRGSKAHLIENKGRTALLEAARFAGLAVVRLLLEHGAPVNILDDFKMSPLMGACWECRPDTVKLLLEKGADPNLIDARGRTAFHAICDFANGCRSSDLPAAVSGRSAAMEIAEMLLKAGARPDIRDRDGRLPVDYLEGVDVAIMVDWIRDKMLV